MKKSTVYLLLAVAVLAFVPPVTAAPFGTNDDYTMAKKKLNLTAEQVEAILTESIEPFTPELGYEPTLDQLTNAYDEGTLTITYEGEASPGVYQYKVTYGGASVIVHIGDIG